MKIRRIHKLIFTLLLGILVVGVTSWRLYPKKPKVNANNINYLYCPKCDKEWPFDIKYKELNDPCPTCSNRRMEPLEKSIKRGGREGKDPYGMLYAIVFAEMVAILAAVWLVTKSGGSENDADYIYMYCPHCEQKLRYTEKQIGKPGACRRCKRAFTFPELEASR